jgi:multidrug efflux pump subunit AcrA (membrane-fusion protein)
VTELKSTAILGRLPKPGKVLKIILACFIIVISFLVITPWQQFALGNGKVIAFSPTERQFTIQSPISGRVQRWYVLEGSRVKKGDLIVALTDNDPDYIQRLRRQKNAIIIQISAAERAIKAGIANLNRQGKLYKAGISSRRTYELAQVEYSKYQDELAQAKIKKINIDVALARQKTQNIKAEASGIIFRRLPGQENVIVAKGDPIAQIVPETPSRAVELWINGNDIAFVRVNQFARLQFEGWPAVQFRGWPEVAIGTFGGRVSFIDATDNGSGNFRVVIVPTESWPDFNYLRQGVRVHGWVRMGRVKLWYELWRQFNGFPPERELTVK